MSKNNRKITISPSLNTQIKGIGDIMRRSDRASALQYVPKLPWMLFLRILDKREQKETGQAKVNGVKVSLSLLLKQCSIAAKLKEKKWLMLKSFNLPSEISHLQLMPYHRQF